MSTRSKGFALDLIIIIVNQPIGGSLTRSLTTHLQRALPSFARVSAWLFVFRHGFFIYDFEKAPWSLIESRPNHGWDRKVRQKGSKARQKVYRATKIIRRVAVLGLSNALVHDRCIQPPPHYSRAPGCSSYCNTGLYLILGLYPPPSTTRELQTQH